ncbi:hypothetical protein RRG08_051450 [Elysia crispata]|uniref:Uncharacterized protein n=1 Tax=Elysia crispata TaxID=231223 RepID=A0AAE1B587_9GAST|nr:hypothetical protein RRG08_051450 [Elysia crispata]
MYYYYGALKEFKDIFDHKEKRKCEESSDIFLQVCVNKKVRRGENNQDSRKSERKPQETQTRCGQKFALHHSPATLFTAPQFPTSELRVWIPVIVQTHQLEMKPRPAQKQTGLLKCTNMYICENF